MDFFDPAGAFHACRTSENACSLLIAFLVRQQFNMTLRDTEGMLKELAAYFGIDSVPDQTSLCRKNKEKR